MPKQVYALEIHVLPTNPIKHISLMNSYFFEENYKHIRSFPGGGKEPAFAVSCQCRRHKRCRFDPWVGKISWRREWQHTPVFLPGEFHRQKSLVGRLQFTQRTGHDWTINKHIQQILSAGTQKSKPKSDWWKQNYTKYMCDYNCIHISANLVSILSSFIFADFSF